MKQKIQNLHDFLEKLHGEAECAPSEKWTDCATIEMKLKEAQEAIEEGGEQAEMDELTNVIIPELEYMQKICSLPDRITNDDDALCGV